MKRIPRSKQNRTMKMSHRNHYHINRTWRIHFCITKNGHRSPPVWSVQKSRTMKTRCHSKPRKCRVYFKFNLITPIFKWINNFHYILWILWNATRVTRNLSEFNEFARWFRCDQHICQSSTIFPNWFTPIDTYIYAFACDQQAVKKKEISHAHNMHEHERLWK